MNRSDYIGFHFGQQIRDIAPRHTLIADIGVASYILTVLVPELTILLIRDDMKITRKKAHIVLKESTELGEILNDDES